MTSVLQRWVTDLPLMQQGTLMTSVRGPDFPVPKLKPVTRWLRSLLLVNGNVENDFMDVLDLPSVEEFEEELEFVPVHYFLHLLHSLEIVGYCHPDSGVREIAFDYYHRLCDWLHVYPEPRKEMEERLSGKPGTTGSMRRWARDYDERGEEHTVREVVRVVERAPQPQAPVHTRHGNSGY